MAANKRVREKALEEELLCSLKGWNAIKSFISGMGGENALCIISSTAGQTEWESVFCGGGRVVQEVCCKVTFPKVLVAFLIKVNFLQVAFHLCIQSAL